MRIEENMADIQKVININYLGGKLGDSVGNKEKRGKSHKNGKENCTYKNIN